MPSLRADLEYNNLPVVRSSSGTSSMKCIPKIILIVILFQIVFLFPLIAPAQEEPIRKDGTNGLNINGDSSRGERPRKKFYVGMEIGAGELMLSRNDVPANRTTRFALGFYGGYAPFRWLRAGINLNGWLIEPYWNFNSNPENGISISNIYGQVQIFPFRKSNLFVSFKAGKSDYINMHRNEYYAYGSGSKAGLGYEHEVAPNLGLTLVVNYGWGSFGDVYYVGATPVTHQHYNVIEFLLGITYR